MNVPMLILAAAASSAQVTAERLVSAMTAEERVEQLMMDAPAIPRLGIPAYHWWNEALHGAARTGVATVFPQSMAMAATFDKDLQFRVADAISTEARAKYNLFSARGERRIYEGLTLWSPNVNMFRDPRWGRGQETFGEDPFLAGRMGVAFVKGIQGDDPRYLKAAACAKHFAVHSGPESLRHGFSAEASRRDLAEYYLPAFKDLVVEGRVESVMGAYSAINGVPCCANKWLLTDLLRGEWGFGGHVVSDVGAVRDILTGHRYAADQVAACKAAIAAGLDLCSEGTYSCLKAALADGRVSADELKAPLVRLFATRTKLGQFNPPGSTPWDALGAESVASPKHRALACEAAEKAMVLVHNNGVLPIDPEKTRGICVIGPRAQDEVALFGNYNGYSAAPVTCATGVMTEAGPGVRCSTEEPNYCDIAIACVGITAEDEGEEGCSANNAGGDRTSYALPEKQLALLRDLKSRWGGRKVVAVVFGCSPFDLKPVAEICDAVVVAWYPGGQGGRALARLLFGRANFSGRLPITYPTSYEALPDIKDYSLKGRTYRYGEPAAYPFGYGLSYTTFSYGEARATVGATEVTVEVEVANTGTMDGDEVVQAYVCSPASADDRRNYHLEGFARVSLKAGERRKVSLSIPKSRFAQFGEDGRASIARGTYSVFVGGGQPGFTPDVRAVRIEL